MARQFTLHGVTFRIDKELTCKKGTKTDPQKEKKDLGYISTKESGEVDAWSFNSEPILFDAKITVIAGDEKEIQHWKAGLCQNVLEYKRVAYYENAFVIGETMIDGPPIRDGEFAEIPFSYNEMTLFDDEDDEEEPEEEGDEEEEYDDQDDPGWLIPAKVTWEGSNASLETVQVENTLVTWLALAREKEGEENKLYLIAKVLWKANFDLIMNKGVLRFMDSSTLDVLNISELNPLACTASDYDINSKPVVFEKKPDLRCYVSGNEARRGQLYGPMSPDAINVWKYDDNDCPLPDDGVYEVKPANWLIPASLRLCWPMGQEVYQHCKDNKNGEVEFRLNDDSEVIVGFAARISGGNVTRMACRVLNLNDNSMDWNAYGDRDSYNPEDYELILDIPADIADKNVAVTGIGLRSHDNNLTNIALRYRKLNPADLANGFLDPELCEAFAEESLPKYEVDFTPDPDDNWVIVGIGIGVKDDNFNVLNLYRAPLIRSC